MTNDSRSSAPAKTSLPFKSPPLAPRSSPASPSYWSISTEFLPSGSINFPLFHSGTHLLPAFLSSHTESPELLQFREPVAIDDGGDGGPAGKAGGDRLGFEEVYRVHAVEGGDGTPVLMFKAPIYKGPRAQGDAVGVEDHFCSVALLASGDKRVAMEP